MTSFSNLILVYDKENRGFVEKLFYNIIAYTHGNISPKNFCAMEFLSSGNIPPTLHTAQTSINLHKSTQTPLFIKIAKTFKDFDIQGEQGKRLRLML